MGFQVDNINPRIGSRVTADKATLLGGVHAKELRETLEQRGVLIFPKMDMTPEEQLEFSRTLGTVIDQGEKGIYKISLDAKVTTGAEYLHGTVLWHFDGWVDKVPALGSILTAHVLSRTGGQTEFANAYAAYDDLSDAMKAKIANLQVRHSMMGTQRYVENPTDEQVADWARYPVPSHPLVWTHRSGRKSLLLGASAEYIEGMDRAESDALLEELKAWAVQPQFVYRHEWTVGDMIMWDNCGVLHRVEAYPADSGRLMHRVTLVGEETIA